MLLSNRRVHLVKRSTVRPLPPAASSFPMAGRETGMFSHSAHSCHVPQGILPESCLQHSDMDVMYSRFLSKNFLFFFTHHTCFQLPYESNVEKKIPDSFKVRG